jgi:hypothetical protein
MSISPVGNSDAYDRYRQQQLDLLASASQPNTQNVLTPQTTSPSSGDPTASTTSSTDPVSSGSYAAKFKADLSALSSPQGGTSGPHGAHGHHHHGGGGALASSDTNLTDPTTDPDSTNSTSSTDPFSAALNDFADLVSEPTDLGAA